MTKADIKYKYDEVGYILQSSLSEAKSIQLIDEEENDKLAGIISQLEEINTNFQAEIKKLESSSEWDKFCMAFFGETNAGKSTIIESLRIIYNEENRRVEMMKQKEQYELALSKHCKDYNALVKSLGEVNIYLSEKENGQRKFQIIKSIAFILLGFLIAFILAQLELF